MSPRPEPDAIGPQTSRTDPWRWLLMGLSLASVSWRVATLADRPIWFDEAFSWQLTRFSWSEMLDRTRADFNPPLYYFVLKLFTEVLGDSLFVLRLPSLLSYVAALGGAWLLARELNQVSSVCRETPSDFPRIAVLLIATSSPLFYYSQEIRMYAQMVALALLSSGLLLRALRESAHPTRWWLAYAGCAAALAYTHSVGLFTVAAQAAFLAVFFLTAARRSGRLLGDVRLRWAALAGALIALLYLPWVPTLLEQRHRAGDEYWTAALPASSALDPALWHWPVSKLSNLLVFPVSIVAQPWLAVCVYPLVAVAMLLVLSRRDFVGAYLLTGMLVPFLLLYLASRQSGREFALDRLFLAPFALFLVAVALLLARIRPRNLRMAATLVVAGLMGGYGVALGVTGAARQQSSFRGAAEQVIKDAREGDVIATGHPFSYLPMKYHARGRFEVRLIPREKPFGRFEGSSVLGPDDYLPDGLLSDPRSQRLVLVELAESHWTDPVLPKGWTETGMPHLFPAPVRQHGTVSVSVWRCPALDVGP